MNAAEVPEDMVTATVALAGPDWRLEARLTVPRGRTSLRRVLPMVRELTNTVVDVGVKRVEKKGETISCKKGCGACCRQLVPITETEARVLVALVAELPEPRRSEVRGRFTEARRKLEEAGLLDVLLHTESMEQDCQEFGLTYFALGIACPFLEDESCSIHPDRPVACREYLVTSPAENCARPSAAAVRCVEMPLRVAKALGRLAGEPPAGRSHRWVPLIVALEWAEAHREEPPRRPGPEWVRELFQHLTGKEVPAV